MRRILSATFVLLAVIGLSDLALAQAKPQVTITHEMTNQDLNMAELQAFDQVASSNQRMAHRLAANPRLARNESFLDKWPELNSFFDKYPGSKDRFLSDPGNYLPDVHTHQAHRVMAAHQAKSTAAAPAPEANLPPATSAIAPAEKTVAPPPAPASPPAPPGSPTSP